ncbi:MAG: ccr4 associated factor [Sclerophora amabilis]|nr:MAG: ccr4 associated factor [Sclerophora amabilis]
MISPFPLNSICVRCLARRTYSTSLRREAQRSRLPARPPPSGAARLVNRRLIALNGYDAPHFLQGLTTNNIRPGQTTGLYSAFLTAQGRVLNDIFIYPTLQSDSYPPLFQSSSRSEEPTFIIEVDGSEASKLLSHLKRYKLRAKIAIRLLEESEWNVWSVWKEGGWTAYQAPSSPSTGSSADNRDNGGIIIGCTDPRAPGMGRRIVLPSDRKPENEHGEQVDEVDLDAYSLRRLLKGVPEGQAEIFRETALPQESNIDYMGGIDFRKGCYVGQELTIRTHHTGVVRKRILPVQLYGVPSSSSASQQSEEDDSARAPLKLQYNDDVDVDDDNSQQEQQEQQEQQQQQQWPAIPTGTNIFRLGDAKRRSTGKWIRGVGNVGLALCRLEAMTDLKLPGGRSAGFSPDQEFGMEWVGEDGKMGSPVKVKAFIPNWHPRDESKGD